MIHIENITLRGAAVPSPRERPLVPDSYDVTRMISEILVIPIPSVKIDDIVCVPCAMVCTFEEE